MRNFCAIPFAFVGVVVAGVGLVFFAAAAGFALVAGVIAGED